MPRPITRRTFLASTIGLGTAGAAVVAHRRQERLEELVFHRFLGRFRPAIRTIPLKRLDANATFDVCVVGTGPAGSIVAAELVERGLNVVLIESGAGWGPQDTGTAGDLDRYRSVGPLSYPLSSSRLRALGGTSSLWTGRAARLHPVDFERNALTPEGAAWPFTYDQLEPYYMMAERSLRIRGGADSPFRAPRSRPLAGRKRVRSELVGLLDRLQVFGDPPPTSESRWQQGAWRAHVDLLPDLTQADQVTVVTRATATRLQASASGQVDYVLVRDPEGVVRSVRAGRFIIACGAAETARLLMLSRSPEHPQGLGNHAGHVGRYFTEHPLVEITGTIPYTLDARWGAAATTHQFYEELKRQELGGMELTVYLRPGSEQNLVLRSVLEMEPADHNRLSLVGDHVDVFGDAGLDLHLEFSRKDEATFKRARGIMLELFRRAGGRDLRESKVGWAHHHMGTTRMGTDPAANVLDANLRVHGTDNVYVVSSSAFVTGGGGHPTALLVALGHRLVDHLTDSDRASV